MQIFIKKPRGLALRSEATKGFTLIELLVVMAIIGILASIILVSLSEARTRAKDTRIVTDLNQIRTVGELISSTTGGNYANVVNNAYVGTLMNDINDQGGRNVMITGNATGYCVEVKFGSNKWGCVNSGLASNFVLTNNPACDDYPNGSPNDISCP